MSQLQQLLEQLYRPGATELVIATGRPVSLRANGLYRNLTTAAVSLEQLRWLAKDTPLLPLIDEAGIGEIATLVLHGRSVYVQVIRRGEDVMVQLERTDSPVPVAPQTPSIPVVPSVTFAAKPRAATSPEPPADPPPLARIVTAGPVPQLPTETQLADERVEVVPALAALILAARERRATDVHVAAGRAVAGRVLGELVTLETAPRSAADVEALLMPLLGPRRREALATRGYVDLAIEVPNGGRLRGNISRQQGGLKGAFRLALARPHSLVELGLPPELAKLTHNHQGLIVIAGPSGHGKTTTLSALVDLINESEPVHILMIEDPVEIVHPRKAAVISQREVGRHTLSFAAALKASLREDPDVIVIGELRDRETVEIAMTAAETGHLVIATMSTPSAAKTIDRLIDMFPPDEQSQVRASLAGALRAVVAQRLLPTLDGSALVAAIEIIVGVLPLATLIRDNKLFQLPSLMQRGRAMGMRRLDDSLLELVRAGRVSEAAALGAAESRKELLAHLHPEGPAAAPTQASMTSRIQKLGGLFGKRDKDHAVNPIDALFDRLLDEGGSDLHLAVGYPPMLRLRGELVAGAADTLTPDDIARMILPLLSPAQAAHFAASGDLDFAHAHGTRARFRANYLRRMTGMGAVFRAIPTQLRTLDELGVPAGVRKLADLRAGLVLVTGPTGSGKSTTLAAMIDHVNRTRRGHILTIEDPVEFVHQPIQCLVTHKEVGEQVPSFLEAIRSAGREDADVILVGELRGAETMKAALQLASFGVLIYATVHTNSAGATIDRFINAFPAEQQPQIRGLLADSLAGVVAQQLLRRADGPGRVAAHEVLLGNHALASVIREGKLTQIGSLLQSGAGEGMQSMDAALERLVAAGTVGPQDALDKALDKESFSKLPLVARALGPHAQL